MKDRITLLLKRFNQFAGTLRGGFHLRFERVRHRNDTRPGFRLKQTVALQMEEFVSPTVLAGLPAQSGHDRRGLRLSGEPHITIEKSLG